MKRLRFIGFLLLSLCLISKTYSQGYLSVHAGPSIPLLEFAEDYESWSYNDGGAATGYTAGLQYVYQFTKCGLGVFTEIDFIHNGLTKEYKQQFEEDVNWQKREDTDFKLHKYINLPIIFGLNYTLTNNNIGVFADAGFAINFLKLTDAKVRIEQSTYHEQMKPTANIGFLVGGGILIKKKASVSVHYLALGNHQIDSDITYNTISPPHLRFPSELKVDILTVTLGYRFKQ